MNLDQQVVSRELAKRLQELGVKQESLFYWINDISDEKWSRIVTVEQYRAEGEGHYARFFIVASAFTVAELGEMQGFKKWACHTSFVNAGDSMKWICVSPSCDAARQYADTEADARAKMLIHLIENKLITV